MAEGITATIDARSYKRLLGKLSAIEKREVPKALIPAMNTAASEIRKGTVKALTAIKSAGSREVGKRVRVYRAGQKKPVAKVWIGIKATVRSRLTVLGLRRVIHGKHGPYLKGAFKTNNLPFRSVMPNGHEGQFVRYSGSLRRGERGVTWKGRLSKGRTSGRPRTSSENLPIQEVEGNNSSIESRVSLYPEARRILRVNARHVQRSRFVPILRRKLRERLARLAKRGK